MNTYKELLQAAREFLEERGIADAHTDAWYLLSYVYEINRADFIMHGHMIETTRDKATKYRDLIEKRASNIPLQYLTRTQEFMGLEFEVNESVLIPRQDTEVLVEEILKVSRDKSVLDMCTGSGCIIISLAKLGSLTRAVGVDISTKALQVAKRNSNNHNVDVDFIHSDLFDEVVGSYDIIVSNPPYIKSEELLSLMPEVKDHEPILALEAGADGLIFYRRIIHNIDKYLNPEGHVFFEIGHDQGEAVSSMLDKVGFVDVNVKKDFGGLDRIVYGRKSFR